MIDGRPYRLNLSGMSSEEPQITRLLKRWQDGDQAALDQLMPVVYEHLRERAHQRLTRDAGAASLNTTALVHEAYLKLADYPNVAFSDRDHFLAVASRVMRNVLVDHSRARGAAKRGGGATVLELREDVWVAQIDLDAVADLDDALKKLERMDARQSRILEQRYFGGMSLEEIAGALNLSLATVKRDLRSARAWLAAELKGDPAR